MKYIYLLLLTFILLIALASCSRPPTPPVETAPSDVPEKIPPSDVPEEIHHTEINEEEYEIKITPDGTKYIIDPEKIRGGGPPKDGIPSIDSPKYVSLQEADEWIQDNELVLAIIYKGVKRVYPLQIMVWHEIVNDVIAGDPLLITY